MKKIIKYIFEIDNPENIKIIVKNDKLYGIKNKKCFFRMSVLQLNHSIFETEDGEAEMYNFVSREGEQTTIFIDPHDYNVLSSLTEQEEIKYWIENYEVFDQIDFETINFD